MTNSEDSKVKFKLRGQENYIECSKRFQAHAKIKKWGKMVDGRFVSTSDEKESEAFEWILNNIADEAIQPISIERSLSENLEQLNDTFGYGRIKPVAQEQTILDR